MNWYLAAALVLQVALIPARGCAGVLAGARMVALGLAGSVQALAILCLAVGYREPGLASMAVVLAALSQRRLGGLRAIPGAVAVTGGTR